MGSRGDRESYLLTWHESMLCVIRRTIVAVAVYRG